MKKYILLLFLISLTPSLLFSQDSISCFFGTESTTHESEPDTTGSEILELKVKMTMKEPDSVKQDYRVNFSVNHLSKSEQKIKIITPYLFFTREEFTEIDTVTKSIKLEIHNDTIKDVKSFFINLSLDSKVVNNSSDSTILVNITTKRKALNQDLVSRLSINDTTRVGQISLLTLQDIPLYKAYKRHENTECPDCEKKKKKQEKIYLEFYKDSLNKKIKELEKGTTKSSSKGKKDTTQNAKEIEDYKKKVKETKKQLKIVGEQKTICSCHRFRRKNIRKEIVRNSGHSQSARRHKRFKKNFETTDKNIEIEKVHITISDGQINTISVKIKGECAYYKNRGPISLTNYDNKKYYHLHYIGVDKEKDDTYISLKDFLDYRSASNRVYFPTAEELELDQFKRSKVLTLMGNPNSFFDTRVYTDTKALSGEDNGLVQTEVNAQFITNSNNLGRSYMGFARKVNVGLSWSKFDSNFDTLKFESFSSVRNNDLLNILRRSNTSFFAELDAISGTRVHDAYLKLGIKVYRTRIFDLTANENAFHRVFTPNFYAALGGRVFASPRINADFRFPFYIGYLHDQPFQTYHNKWSSHIAPEIEITLQLRKPEVNDEKQRSFVFARVRYFDMPFSRGNNYWQIQTGVEIPFSSLFE